MRKLLGILLRQHQVGQLPGAIKFSFGRTLAYVGYVNFALLGAVAYNTTLRDILLQYMPWLTFPAFMGIMVAGVMGAMWLDYKFMMPSEMHFSQKQTWRHKSPVRGELKRILEKLEQIEKKIDKGGS